MPDQARAFGAQPMIVPIVKSRSFSDREPGQHVEFAEGSRQEPRASNGYHAAPLEQLAHPHQRVAEPLPNPLSDDVSRKEKLCARRDRHGDK